MTINPRYGAVTATMVRIARCHRNERLRNSQLTTRPTRPTAMAATAAARMMSSWSAHFMSEPSRSRRGRGLPRISDAPHRLQPDRMRRILLDLLAQAPHMDRHGRPVTKGPTPHPLEQL